MKKIIFYTFPSLLALAALSSCEKNSDKLSKQIVIDTTLTSGTEYRLDLQPYGDADDVATIRKQGTNFTTSEITNAAGTFAPVYHYAATGNTKLALTDQVVLSVTEGDRGNGNSRHHGDSTLITINFTVK